MLQLDLQQIFSQVLSFLLLLWVLRRFAWKPLLSALDARREHIESELSKAAQGRQEMERLQEDYRKRLSSIEEESRSKIQQAVIEGKRISGEIQEEARGQAHAIITKAKEAVEMELAKAKVTLRDQIARMTVNATERLLRRKLDEKADRHLVDEALKELERMEAKR